MYGKWVILSSSLFVTICSYSASNIVKTYDNNRALCRTAAHVEELAQKKAVLVTPITTNEIEIQLVKCTFDGWILDNNPAQERVDNPKITNFAIYQNFHQYFFYMVRGNKLIQSAELSELLTTGKQKLEIADWDPHSEIFVSAITSKQNDAGQIIDEKHEESFGVFNIF